MDSPKSKGISSIAQMNHALTGLLLMPLAALTACAANDAERAESYDGIGADEVIQLSGNEPFWGAKIAGRELTYTTPDNIDGIVTSVERFAGNGGLSFSGTLNGADLVAVVTPGKCSDGMSDFSYPFTATMALGEELLIGCARTDQQPATERPPSSDEAGR